MSRCLVLVGALLWAGCGGTLPEDSVRSSFNQAYVCPEELIEVRQVDGARFEASGCQHKRTYVCPPGWCRPESEDAQSSEVADRAKWLQVIISHETTWVTFTATPATSEIVTATFGAVDRPNAKCQLEAMIEGERLELAHVEGKPLTLRVPRDVMRDFGVAAQAGFGTCGQHWSLTRKQLDDLREFVAKYETELGWQGKARSGSSGGHLPPAGGWPAWKSLGDLPAAAPGEALQPTQLFEKLVPSIVRVEASLDDGMAQGSAVAVTPSLLVTNCHVVAGSKKVVVKQRQAERQTEWVAHLVQSDPKADRCVLEVTSGNFTPVAGVRAYSDLKVGEALFTLGAPSGLDLSLSDGLLSGLREEEGVRYVQTTAPISPGSSGGGLFDNRGNLIGITTLVLTGRRQLNQSLNFAVAADGFWKQ